MAKTIFDLVDIEVVRRRFARVERQPFPVSRLHRRLFAAQRDADWLLRSVDRLVSQAIRLEQLASGHFRGVGKVWRSRTGIRVLRKGGRESDRLFAVLCEAFDIQTGVAGTGTELLDGMMRCWTTVMRSGLITEQASMGASLIDHDAWLSRMNSLLEQDRWNWVAAQIRWLLIELRQIAGMTSEFLTDDRLNSIDAAKWSVLLETVFGAFKKELALHRRALFRTRRKVRDQKRRLDRFVEKIRCKLA